MFTIHSLNRLKKVFSVDLRSLALMRILVSVLLMYDIGNRGLCLSEHYTDAGVLPRSVLFSIWKIGNLSFHSISGDVFFQGGLFCFAFVLAIGLLLGYKTRLVSVLCWVFLMSLQNRNPMLNYGGDKLLVILLFLGMLLPWGKKWSWDSRGGERGGECDFFGLASIAYIVQFCCLFWFASIMKIQSGWTINYDSLYYVVASNSFRTPLLSVFQYFPEFFFTVGTVLIIYFDIIFPILFLIPFKHQFFRKWVVIDFIIKHIIFNLFLFLGIFSVVVSVFMVGLLPASVWEFKLMKRLSIRLDKLFVCREKHEVCRISNKFSVVKNLVSIYFIVTIIWSNLYSVYLSPIDFPKRLRQVAYAMHINQSWHMFSPIMHEDYWPTVVGELTSGKTINVLNPEKEITNEPPDYLAMEIGHERRYSYFINLESDSLLKYYSYYQLSEWNKEHSGVDKMEKINIRLNYRSILSGFEYTRTQSEEIGEYFYK